MLNKNIKSDSYCFVLACTFFRKFGLICLSFFAFQFSIAGLTLLSYDFSHISINNAFAASATPWLIEDFSTYTDTANFKRNPRGIYTSLVEPNGGESTNIDLVTLDQSIGYDNLTQSLLYSFPDRTPQVGATKADPYCHDYSIGVNIKLPSPTQEVWVEIIAMFSPNFKTLAPIVNGVDCSGIGGSGADYKFIFLRTTGIVGRFNLLAGTGGGGWTFGYPGNTEGSNSDKSPFYGNTPYPFSITGNPFDGKWHKYFLHAKIGANGTASWWLDGVKQPSFPSLDLSKVDSIYGIALGRNLNQGPAAPQSIRWGRITVWNSNPFPDRPQNPIQIP